MYPINFYGHFSFGDQHLQRISIKLGNPKNITIHVIYWKYIFPPLPRTVLPIFVII